MLKQEKFKINSSADGLALGVLLIEPQCKPKAVVQIAHGMSEYKERYIPLMEFLAENGYACIIHDHRGHGESVKEACDLGFFYENGASLSVEDTHQITIYAKERFPGVPIYLLGHSMGSLIVRAYTKKYDSDINALIVSGCPSYNKATKLGSKLVDMLIKLKGERYVSKFCDGLFVNAFNAKFKSEGERFAWLSVNKENVKNYEADPLCGFSFTLNGYKALVGIMLEVYSKEGWNLNNKKLPVWFISGADDPCMIDLPSFIRAVDLMRSVGYENVSYKIYEGMRHEIFNEDVKLDVYRDVCNKLDGWLSQ